MELGSAGQAGWGSRGVPSPHTKGPRPGPSSAPHSQSHDCRRVPPPPPEHFLPFQKHLDPLPRESLAEAVLSFSLFFFFLVCVFQRTESKLSRVAGAYERSVYFPHTAAPSLRPSDARFWKETPADPVRTAQMAGLKRGGGVPPEAGAFRARTPRAHSGGGWEAPASLPSFPPYRRPWDLPEAQFWGRATATPAVGRGDSGGPKAGAWGMPGERDVLGQYFYSVILHSRPMRTATFSNAIFAFVED